MATMLRRALLLVVVALAGAVAAAGAIDRGSLRPGGSERRETAAETPSSSRSSTSRPSTSASTSTSTTSTTAPPAPPSPPPTPPGSLALCIGDSVLLGAGPTFANTLSMCGVVDAAENRQLHEGDDAAAIHLLAGGGTLPHTVVVMLGNNGYTSAAEIDGLLGVLTPAQRVVLVTVQIQRSRPWQDAVNAEIRAAAQRHPTRVVVADWQAATEGHPEWFGSDGIHIAGNPAGALVLAATILEAL